jgi:hypothetical protein
MEAIRPGLPGITVFLLASLACGRTTPPPTQESGIATTGAGAAPVPEAFEPVYESLSETLAGWEAELATMSADPTPTTFGAELLVANGNRGAALLQASTLPGVRLYLDRLQDLGVGGVTVAITDPLLWPDYPDNEAYASFFKEVAQEVRLRGLKLLVETGPAFTGTAFSSISFDWGSLTLEAYREGRLAQLVRVAQEVKPDYLSIGGEPGTEAMLTGFSFSVDEHLTFVQEAAEAIHGSSGVLVGAGSGSWEDPSFGRRMAEEPALDFVGVHVYPLTNGFTDYLERAKDTVEVARAAGKRVVMGEAWLYKATSEELRRGLGYADIYARDAYVFWQPLDVRFVQLMGGLARAWGIEYASFFWSGFFFDYLEYDESLPRLPLPELLHRLNRDQAASLQAGALSDTGRAFQALIRAGE